MKKVIILLSVVFLAGCSSIKLKRHNEKSSEPQVEQQVEQIAEKAKEVSSEETPSPEEEPTTLVEGPKLGVILGPGGIKAYAHTGVIKELVKAKVKINHIVGIEWGALVAALYAQNAQIHQAEWSLYKLESKDLMEKGLFSERYKAKTVDELDGFLGANLTKSVENTDVSFSCPTSSIWSQSVTWVKNGSLKEAVKKCLPYPPLFKPKSPWMAAPFSIAETVRHLKNKGVEIIIYVDVLGSSSVLENKDLIANYQSALLWRELKRYTKNFDFTGIEKIMVDTRRFRMYDFNSRNALVSAGESAARKSVDRIIKNYNF